MSLLDMSYEEVEEVTAISSERDLKEALLTVSSVDVKSGEGDKGPWHNLSIRLEIEGFDHAKSVYDTQWLPTPDPDDRKKTDERLQRFRKFLQCYGIIPYYGDDSESIKASIVEMGELLKQWGAGTEEEDEFTQETAILNGLARTLENAQVTATLNVTGTNEEMKNTIRFYHYPKSSQKSKKK